MKVREGTTRKIQDNVSEEQSSKKLENPQKTTKKTNLMYMNRIKCSSSLQCKDANI
jgi:hypothetical protein